MNRLVDLQDIIPVARDSVVENMGDAVIVLNHEDRILDLNTDAQRLIGHNQKRLLVN